MPAAFPRSSGVTAHVTGEAAGVSDFNQLMHDRAPIVIGFVLLVSFLLLLATLATTEFRPSKRKPFLLTALAMALLVFGLLSFGQNATAQHESVASLYGYFGATVILMLFVRTLPPYASNRWLG